MPSNKTEANPFGLKGVTWDGNGNAEKLSIGSVARPGWVRAWKEDDTSIPHILGKPGIHVAFIAKVKLLLLPSPSNC